MNTWLTVATNAVQGVNGTIPGMTSTPGFGSFPGSLNTAMLPLSIAWPDEGQTLSVSPAMRNRSQVMIADFYLFPRSSNHVALLQKSATLYAAAVETWGDLHDAAGGYQLDDGSGSGFRVLMNFELPIEDSGIVGNMRWNEPDDLYYGFQLRIPLLIQWGSGVC